VAVEPSQEEQRSLKVQVRARGVAHQPPNDLGALGPDQQLAGMDADARVVRVAGPAQGCQPGAARRGELGPQGFTHLGRGVAQQAT